MGRRGPQPLHLFVSRSHWQQNTFSTSSTHTDYAYDTLGRISTITEPVKSGGTSQLSNVKYTTMASAARHPNHKGSQTMLV
jgi:hypothetical protein